ncbi:hypothetical protein ACTI_58940 [Actinoplanes sp. OR16]|uniref:hypothetical protein n=1 Tax=Actinoplanes sp. OR16 TaxID=946334 RepID=UPI000F6DF80B|nr:hypothetical protein [Actinoplanes sp. OR16]BBH69209.1 hypothetical protein ACTI_58940 [Actinoplanes sp. OR16]
MNALHVDAANRQKDDPAAFGVFIGTPAAVAGGLLPLGAHRSPPGFVVLAAGLLILVGAGTGHRVADSLT